MARVTRWLESIDYPQLVRLSGWSVRGTAIPVKKTQFIFLTMLTLALSFATSTTCGNESVPSVSKELAHELALSTLMPSARHLPGMRFDREQGAHPEGFYWFEITAEVPAQESPLLGYFAVNMLTGDVWNPVPCIKLTSVVIRDFQEQLRQKATLSAAEIRRAGVPPCQP